MSELGDLLEVLHGPPVRWRTLQATVRSWTHTAAAQRAFARETEGDGAAGVSFYAPGAEPEVREVVTRVWLRPGAARTEGGHGDGFAVKLGDRWWHYTPGRGAVSNVVGDEIEPVESAVGEEFDALWRPWPVAGLLSFHGAEAASWIGRPALRARATPAPDLGRLHRFELHALGSGATEYELLVDRERGVLLRCAALVDGEEFQINEVTAIAFDENLADELFTFVEPEGVDVIPVSEEQDRPRDGQLWEIARDAPFTVWAPMSLDAAWEITASTWGDDDGVQVSLSAHLHRPGGQASFHISQSPASGPRTGYDPHDPGWRTEQHGGRELHITEPGGPLSRVKCLYCELGGTHIEMQSQTLDAAALIEIALALGPAATGPPPTITR